LLTHVVFGASGINRGSDPSTIPKAEEKDCGPFTVNDEAKLEMQKLGSPLPLYIVSSHGKKPSKLTPKEGGIDLTWDKPLNPPERVVWCGSPPFQKDVA
jgi:hypothetical protein